ncbi:chaplin [Streptomyces sp. P17]|uniref:chaplin n=1 Tax=Streptomyces sp. P17 TaxID=3074716 RepID=UPI0028F413E7|nr:chaplin [Streptomyces sp. P17]MDT9700196.1 chaplin [Streptomyces sp. P17]
MSRIAKAAVVAVGTGAMVVGGAGLALADAGANGKAVKSPGVGSGNLVQVPVHVPINLCGNTVNVIALLNPAFGNTCANVDDKDNDDKNGGYGNGKGDHGKGGKGGNGGNGGYGD